MTKINITNKDVVLEIPWYEDKNSKYGTAISKLHQNVVNENALCDLSRYQVYVAMEGGSNHANTFDQENWNKSSQAGNISIINTGFSNDGFDSGDGFRGD
ncbi:hypothetical protein IL306_010882 [Fusarium sp. DS 682]|nr:hypothetical protein IL306_010882 [Fusarium sp. DS 682]